MLLLVFNNKRPKDSFVHQTVAVLLAPGNAFLTVIFYWSLWDGFHHTHPFLKSARDLCCFRTSLLGRFLTEEWSRSLPSFFLLFSMDGTDDVVMIRKSNRPSIDWFSFSSVFSRLWSKYPMYFIALYIQYIFFILLLAGEDWVSFSYEDPCQPSRLCFTFFYY